MLSYTSISICPWPGGLRSSTIMGQTIVLLPTSNAHVVPPLTTSMAFSLRTTPFSWPISYRTNQVFALDNFKQASSLSILNLFSDKGNFRTTHLWLIGMFKPVCIFCNTLQEKHVFDGSIQQRINATLLHHNIP